MPIKKASPACLLKEEKDILFYSSRALIHQLRDCESALSTAAGDDITNV